MPSGVSEHILIGMQESSTNMDSTDFEMGQDSNDELPQLQKTSSELVHAQKVHRKKNAQTYNYKMVGQRKHSNSGIDKSMRSKEKIALFTQSGEIEHMNVVKQPLILKQTSKEQGGILQLQRMSEHEVGSSKHSHHSVSQSQGTGQAYSQPHYHDQMNSFPAKLDRQKYSAQNASERASVAVSSSSKSKCRSKKNVYIVP